MQKPIEAVTEKIEEIFQEAHILKSNIKRSKQIYVDFRLGAVLFKDPVHVRTEKHEKIDFKQINDPYLDTSDFIERINNIKVGGGGDGPEDYVGALDLVIKDFNERGNIKLIVFITDSPAHGERFCARINHQEEEPKLVEIVKRLAEDKFIFVGLSMYAGADISFKEMRDIYIEAGGEEEAFKIHSIAPQDAEMNEEILTSTKNDISFVFDKYVNRIIIERGKNK